MRGDQKRGNHPKEKQSPGVETKKRGGFRSQYWHAYPRQPLSGDLLRKEQSTPRKERFQKRSSRGDVGQIIVVSRPNRCW